MFFNYWIGIVIWNHILYRLLVLDRINWNYITVQNNNYPQIKKEKCDLKKKLF